MASFEVLYPRNIEELSNYLVKYKNDVKILAGGTDLIVNIKSEKISCKYLISLKKVQEFNADIKNQGDKLVIGPLATMAEIHNNKEINEYFAALSMAAYIMGSQQIRNQATLAGNICNASPAAETATPLLIYNASVNIQGSDAQRKIPIKQFWAGPGKTTLKADEFVTGVNIPIPKIKEKSIYKRISRREGVDLAIVNMSLSIDEAGNVKLAYGSLGPVPFRVQKVEEAIKQYINRQISDKELHNAIENSISPISDLRSSKEYKSEMIKLLTVKGIEELLSKKEG